MKGCFAILEVECCHDWLLTLTIAWKSSLWPWTLGLNISLIWNVSLAKSKKTARRRLTRLFRNIKSNTAVQCSKWRHVTTHTGSRASAWNSICHSSPLGDGNVPMLCKLPRRKPWQLSMNSTNDITRVICLLHLSYLWFEKNKYFFFKVIKQYKTMLAMLEIDQFWRTLDGTSVCWP